MTGAPGLRGILAKLTRRRFLIGVGAAAGATVTAGVAAGCGTDQTTSASGRGNSSRGNASASGDASASGGSNGSSSSASSASSEAVPHVTLGTQPTGLPVRQHAWNSTLATDSYGNPVAPSHRRLLFFDVNGDPTPAHARLLEAALRTLERTYQWGPSGLLFTAGWGNAYFAKALRVASPIPAARALSDFELPVIDDHHLCLHLACDDEARLAAVEAALVTGKSLPSADGPLHLASALRWRETRTGFVGKGLPAAHQDTDGIPPGHPVPATAPLFMGFKSGFTHNLASEDDVTIPDGPFAQGTTRHVSYMRLRLDSWYQDLSRRERIARMYAPQVTPQVLSHFTTDAKSDPELLGQAITRYGVIGHAQTCARARRDGRPVILRRDFNTTDGGEAGLHFVSVQRTIQDFVATRTAMNATSAQLKNPAITDTVNNGINEYIFVLKRGNYLVPPRDQRSFPLLPGRQEALT